MHVFVFVVCVCFIFFQFSASSHNFAIMEMVGFPLNMRTSSKYTIENQRIFRPHLSAHVVDASAIVTIFQSVQLNESGWRVVWRFLRLFVCKKGEIIFHLWTMEFRVYSQRNYISVVWKGPIRHGTAFHTRACHTWFGHILISFSMPHRMNMFQLKNCCIHWCHS